MSISASSLSILVIDENISRSSLIETALMQEGHSNVYVANSIDGVGRKIAELEPDVIEAR